MSTERVAEFRSLRRLARLHGVQTAYTDVTGVRRDASPESIVAVLRGLGVPVDGPDDADQLADERSRAIGGQALEPVAVVRDGGDAGVELTLPDPPRVRSIDVELVLEDGVSTRTRHRLDELDVTRRRTVGGVPLTTRRVPVGNRLPFGYHAVTIDHGSALAEATLISAPTLAYKHVGDGHRIWGVFAPLHAIRSSRSTGVGSFTDLEALTRWIGEKGAGVVGTLPILSAFLDEPFEPSPFVPVSRTAWNELYIDIAAVPELESAQTARRIVEGKRFARDAAALRSLDEVDYRKEMVLKRRVLEHCAKSLFADPSQRLEALTRWIAEHPTVSDYAAFRAMCEKTRTGWHGWPERMRSGSLEEGDYDQSAYRYHVYVQWLADEAVSSVAAAAAEQGPGLYLDLPVGVHPDGFDVWRERELYTSGLSVGSPPDPLATTGQDWGFPALVPDAVRDDRYRHVIAYVRHHMSRAGILRIDHVMGLHRIFCIPHGMGGTDGVYVRNRPDELYALFCLESVRNGTMIVGEDLGTVPEAVRPAMAKHGLLRMHVVQSEVHEDLDRAFSKVPRNAVASVNTHDMPPFAAFWSGVDIERFGEMGIMRADEIAAAREERDRLRRRVELRLASTPGLTPPIDPMPALEATLAALASSDAPVMLVTLEDLWLEDRPQNVPGTLDQPNWRRKMRLSLEAMCADAGVGALLERVDQLRRAPPGEAGVSSHPADPSPIAGANEPAHVRPITDVVLTDDDRHLFAEGNHARLYQKLGAHMVESEGRTGTRFAVWAPAAREVSVIGTWNDWRTDTHPMRPVATSGIWETFIPGVGAGAHYKFHIASHIAGASGDKADPFAFAAEHPPRTASIVHDTGAYEWHDEEWMVARPKRQALNAPMSIYEVHLGSWRRVAKENDRPLTYRELADRLTSHVEKMGYTHVELMPVMEHPFYGSWGYQVTGYFAPTARYGPPDGLVALIDACHRAGIGVILDWVPSHFPTDAHGLGFFDGTHLYEHADPRQGFHPDWKSFIFNYGRGEVVSFLLSNAAFWLDRYHVDALRVDAVASMLYLDYSRKAGEWVPNRHGGRENLDAIAFLEKLNTRIGESFPGTLAIAEESTAWPLVTRPTYLGGLGFHLKWDMGWMHDTLTYMQIDPFFRSHHHHTLTFRAMYASSENFVLALSHDEVVHGKRSLLSKMPGDWWKQFAGLRALYGYMWGLPGKKLLFMGAELGQWTEWDHETELDWSLADEPMHAGLARWVADLNALYREESALHELDVDAGGFEWIDCHDHSGSTLSFLRKDARGGAVAVLCNFTPEPRHDFRIGVPHKGFWRELLNGDETRYGGSGVVNSGAIQTEDVESHGRPFRLAVTLPPLGVVFLKAPERGAGG